MEDFLEDIRFLFNEEDSTAGQDAVSLGEDAEIARSDADGVDQVEAVNQSELVMQPAMGDEEVLKEKAEGDSSAGLFAENIILLNAEGDVDVNDSARQNAPAMENEQVENEQVTEKAEGDRDNFSAQLDAPEVVAPHDAEGDASNPFADLGEVSLGEDAEIAGRDADSVDQVEAVNQTVKKKNVVRRFFSRFWAAVRRSCCCCCVSMETD